MKRQAKELKEITTIMTSFPKTIEPTKLPHPKEMMKSVTWQRVLRRCRRPYQKILTSLKLSKDEAEKAYQGKRRVFRKHES